MRELRQGDRVRTAVPDGAIKAGIEWDVVWASEPNEVGYQEICVRGRGGEECRGGAWQFEYVPPEPVPATEEGLAETEAAILALERAVDGRD